jgi:hypothetical protein
MLIGAGAFLDLLTRNRILACTGMQGTGKSLLAVTLAFHMMERGYVDQVVGNLPLVGPSEILQGAFRDIADLEEYHGAAYVYDEAWHDLGSGQGTKKLNDYMAYLRKRQSVLFVTSCRRLMNEISAFKCVRAFQLSRFGLPLWGYRWRLIGDGYVEKGRFLLFRPSQSFSLYDNLWEPEDRWWVVKSGRQQPVQRQKLDARYGLGADRDTGSVQPDRAGVVSGSGLGDNSAELAGDSV